MRNVILATIAVVGLALAAPTPASAFLDDNSCKGNKSCSDNSVDNSVTNKGGNAKAGAAAGVFGSGNSSIGNVGNLKNVGNASVKNSGNSSSTAGVKNSGNSKQAQGQDAHNEQGQSINVEGDTTTVNAEPAIAPGLAALTGTSCMGSTTMSGAGMGLISLGFGTTWTDTECNLRENIKLVAQIEASLAKEMINDLSGVAEARSRIASAAQAKLDAAAAKMAPKPVIAPAVTMAPKPTKISATVAPKATVFSKTPGLTGNCDAVYGSWQAALDAHTGEQALACTVN